MAYKGFNPNPDVIRAEKKFKGYKAFSSSVTPGAFKMVNKKTGKSFTYKQGKIK